MIFCPRFPDSISEQLSTKSNQQERTSAFWAIFLQTSPLNRFVFSEIQPLKQLARLVVATVTLYASSSENTLTSLTALDFIGNNCVQRVPRTCYCSIFLELQLQQPLGKKTCFLHTRSQHPRDYSRCTPKKQHTLNLKRAQRARVRCASCVGYWRRRSSGTSVRGDVRVTTVHQRALVAATLMVLWNIRKPFWRIVPDT